jgi:predicted ATPase
VLRLFRDGARLVTITGPGGIGKTRFALDVAAELIEKFKDGVWWVGLAPVRDPTLVLSTIGAAIGVRDLGELRAKQALLLLDNMEQVVESAPDIAALERTSPELSVLATSREPLHIAGEREYALAPLAESPAAELLRQRAEAVSPDFDAQYGQLVQLCDRLDRLPLAIELAAARTKTLSVTSLLERLDQRLPLLTSRRRDVEERQRTLRATIEWSYDLLAPEEKDFFIRLSVFAGSFDVDAAEHVCDASVDTLEALVDKSLLRRSGDDRFFVLETIREFAVEQLDAREDVLRTRGRHAEYYGSVVCALGNVLELGPEAPEILEHFEREHNNVRAALEYLSERGDRGAELLALIVGRFWPFWWLRGYLDEGRKWLEVALLRAEAGSDAHFDVLDGAAHLAHIQGDQQRCTELGDLFQRLGRKMNDERRIGIGLHLMANAAISSGSLERGIELEEESLQHLEGDDRYSRYPRSGLGYVALLTGDYERGAELLAQVVEFDREIGDVEGVANDLGLLAIAAALSQQDQEACRLLRESTKVAVGMGHAQVLGNRVLPGAAVILQRAGQTRQAVAALSAARAAADARGTWLGPLAEALYQQTWEAAETALGSEIVAAICDEVSEKLCDQSLASFVQETLDYLD